MNRSPASLATTDRDPRYTWVLPLIGLAFVGVLSYLVGWREVGWSWVPAIALGYLLPAFGAALGLGRRWGVCVALVGSVALVPLIWRGSQIGMPLGSLVGVGLLAWVLPIGAYVLGARRLAKDALAQGTASALRADDLAQRVQDLTSSNERARLQLKQLSMLNEMGKAIIANLDLDTVFATMLDQVQEMLGVDAGSLLLVEQDRLVFHTAFGPVSRQVKPFTLQLGQGIAGWVALTGTSVLVPDAQKDERHWSSIDRATSYEARSLLCVPLKGANGKSIGVLEVMNPRRGDGFTRQDQELLESIATFAVIAIQNARLYQETVRYVTDLNALYEMSKEVTASLDIPEMLQVIASEALRLTMAARSQVTLVDTRSRRVTGSVECEGQDSAICTRQTSDDYRQVERGLGGWVLREKRPALSMDIGQDERVQGGVYPSDIRSMIAAPLLVKEQPVGILTAGRKPDAEPFTERELGLLTMLAGQASIAVENAHFYEERKRQIIALSILNQTGQALSSVLKLNDLMELIYRQAARVMDAQHFHIALCDPDPDHIVFPIVYENGVQKAGPDVPATDDGQQPQLTGSELTEYVIRTKQVLWLPDRVSKRLAERNVACPGLQARSWLGVPILSGEEVLGAIVVQSLDTENAYDQEHVSLLVTIAGQASVAIRNAELFDQVRRISESLEHLVTERTEALAQANQELILERDRLNGLYRIMRELSSSLELERMLNRALSLINRLLSAEQGFVLIHDSGKRTVTYTALVGAAPPSVDGQAFDGPRLGDQVLYDHDEGVIGWIMARHEFARIDDLSRAPQWHIVPDQGRWHRSLLAAPLFSGQEIRGLILLYHSRPGHFTPDHQRMLEAVASQVAVSVSSIEMFHLLSEAADRLGNMLRMQQLEAAKSHAILEGVADGVMVADAQGTITLFNAAAERILQTARDQVLGRSEADLSGLFNLTGTSWSELAARWAEDKLASEPEATYEVRFEVQGRVVSMRVAPVVRQGAFEGTVSVMRDITKDVEVDRMKSEFVSMVSHELRTPMTSIKGYIDLLFNEMAGPISDAQKHFLQVVKNNTDRLTVLVNSLLEINRLDTGEISLVLTDVDPLAIITKVVTNLDRRARARTHHVQVIHNGSLPLVRADPTRMAEILTQLLENAIDYTPDGGQIAIEAGAVGDFLHVHVSDNGIGISVEDQTKLFSRFFRADQPLVQAQSGTGLGLSIVKSLVQLHGGEMWFESKPGQGSTFSFSLPLAKERPSIPQFRTISYRSHDKHILVIEDDVSVANLIAHELRNQGGYQVHISRCGRDALDYLASDEHKVDLITLDLRLPDINGMELLNKIKGQASRAKIPIVVVSVLSQGQDERQLGVSAYLPKPLEAGQLLATIDQAFGQACKVLIVEDDSALVELFRAALGEQGFTVVACYEGPGAVDAVHDEKPDLILLDIKLPGDNGYAILSQLKADSETSRIPVIVITGHAIDVDSERRHALGLGAVEFLTKPLNVSKLVGEIQQALVKEPDQGETTSAS